jgi:hypothetical protein
MFSIAPAVIGDINATMSDIKTVCSTFDKKPTATPIANLSKPKKNRDAIIGGVIGGAALITLSVLGFFLHHQKGRNSRLSSGSESPDGSPSIVDVHPTNGWRPAQNVETDSWR